MPEETKTAETWQNPAKSFDSTKTPLPGGALVLHTAEELKIFVNPQRMRLVNLLETMGEPATAKMLADRLGISASSVKHHLNKLESIGLVEIDHQAHIHGILATYYRPTARTVVLDQTNAALRPLAQLAVDSRSCRARCRRWPPGRLTPPPPGTTPGAFCRATASCI